MNTFLNLFRKPSIKAVLIDSGTKAKIDLTNINKQNALVLVFMIIRFVARHLKMSDRELMNKIIDLDKTIVKNDKKSTKKVYKK